MRRFSEASSAPTRAERRDSVRVLGLTRREVGNLSVLLAISGVGNALGFMYFFDVVWSFDKIMHIYTSFVIALLIATLLRDTLFRRLYAHPWLLVSTLVAYGLALGVVWEWIEWVVDIRGYPTVIMGKSDTMIDLIADGIGAAIAGAWVLRDAARS